MVDIIGRSIRINSQKIISILTSLRIVDMIHTQGIRHTKKIHYNAYYSSGAVKPKPETTAFGLGRAILVVMPGLLLGATISKNIANFLEENDLFVPDDDDDDD